MIVKVLWFLLRKVKSVLIYFFFKITEGYFFSNVGKDCIFYGWPTFGSVNGNISIGDLSSVGKHVFFSCSKNGRIVIGKNSSFNTGCHIVAVEMISIGNDVLIAEFVTIRDQNHNYENIHDLIVNQGYSSKPVEIGDGCWIGRGAVILPGVILGRGCIVGANSVVNKSFGDFSVIGGVPAKLLKTRA